MEITSYLLVLTASLGLTGVGGCCFPALRSAGGFWSGWPMPITHRWRAGLFWVAVVAVALGHNPWSIMHSPSAPHLGGVTHKELARMSDAEALTVRPGEAEGAVCERALLIPAGAVSRVCLGTLGVLAVEPGK